MAADAGHGSPARRPACRGCRRGREHAGCVHCGHAGVGQRGAGGSRVRRGRGGGGLRRRAAVPGEPLRSEEHTSELQSHVNLVCRLLLEKKKKNKIFIYFNKNKKKKKKIKK